MLRQLFFPWINRRLTTWGYQINRVNPRGPAKVFARGDFLPHLVAHVDPPSVRVIVDVGAADGGTARQFCRLFPQAVVHCFEPSPDNLVVLRQTSILPEVGGRMIVNSQAISCARGQGMLYRHAAPQTDSLLRETPQACRQWNDGRFDTRPAIEVDMLTVHDYCHDQRLTRIDLLKIDAQGEDLRVLMGCEPLLREHRIGVVIVELYFIDVYEGQSQPEQIIGYLRERQYHPVAYLTHDVGDQGELLCVDAMFVSSGERLT